MRLLKFRPPAAAGHVGDRPRPALGRDNAYFWEGVELGELRLQRCGGCATVRHPPQPVCDLCGSADQGFLVAAGQGRIYSHVTHHYPPLPGVERPHTVLLVELEEGVRLVSELAAGVDPSVVRIGLPVELTFQAAPGGQRLPVFRPAGTVAA